MKRSPLWFRATKKYVIFKVRNVELKINNRDWNSMRIATGQLSAISIGLVDR
jgi:hypothetical protein